MQKEETIENYKVKFKKHIFSKSIKITLKGKNSILVTMPVNCPYKNAKEFLFENFKKIKSYEFQEKIYSENTKTKFDTLKIEAGSTLKTYKKDGIIIFQYPQNLDFNSSIIQEAFKKAYFKAIKIEAQNYLTHRTRFLAQKFGFQIGKIFLKNQKTRFGSCSFQNNINLNISIMKYDFDVIDYVIIHELVHTKIKNHSKMFWLKVEEYCPNYRLMRKKLKQI